MCHTITANAMIICAIQSLQAREIVLLWSLVELHSQTEYPHIFFMGENLPNHGPHSSGDYSDTVRCHTDLNTCCFSNVGIHHGDCYFPNETRPDSSSSGDSHKYKNHFMK